jgi:hypothetical protein
MACGLFVAGAKHGRPQNHQGYDGGDSAPELEKIEPRGIRARLMLKVKVENERQMANDSTVLYSSLVQVYIQMRDATKGGGSRRSGDGSHEVGTACAGAWGLSP